VHLTPGLLWDAISSFLSAPRLGWYGLAYPWKISPGSGWPPASFHNTARRIAGPLNEYCLLTLAAQVTTLPVILYHFQRPFIEFRCWRTLWSCRRSRS